MNFSNHIIDLWTQQKFDGLYSYSALWFATDTEEAFTKNKYTHYTNKDINYHINENGYRIQQNKQTLNGEDNSLIACFGCSQTFGVGVKYEETWPYNLGIMLDNGYNIKNYGVNGASSDTISRLIYCYLLDHKPKAICCLLPDIFRRELFDSSNLKTPRNYNNLWSVDAYTMSASDFCSSYNYDLEDWKAYRRLSEEENSIFNFIKNLKFIESLCESKNVPLYTLTWDLYVLSIIRKKDFYSSSLISTISKADFNVFLNWEKMEKARDGMHLGKSVNLMYAKLFKEAMCE